MGLKFYYENKFDAVEAVDLVVSSAEVAYPKGNLQNAFRKKPWRSTGLSSEYAKWDFGASEDCSHISLINHNLTAEGAVTITASDNADFSAPLLLEIYPAWEPLFGFGEGGFGEHGFGGCLLTAERDDLAPGGLIIFDFSITIARYWKIEFTDAANPDGYIAIGRIITGIPWEVERHIKYGWQITAMDETKWAFSEGGQMWADIKPKRYQINFTFAGITDIEKYWKLIDMLRRWGKRKSILLELLPDGNIAEHFFTTLYGRFREIPAIGQDFIDYSQAQIIFTEDL